MRQKILIIIFILLFQSPALAQSKAKYTPKLPNFFEGSQQRGELISVGQIVATKVSKDEQSNTDTFAVNQDEKGLMANPLGIIPKRKAILKVSETPAVTQKEQVNDPQTAELQAAVDEAKSVSEEIRKAMGGETNYSNPQDINKFVNASEKALQRGQLKTVETKKSNEEYKF